MFHSTIKFLMLVGLVSSVVGGFRYYRMTNPTKWTLEQAKAQLDSSRSHLVTISAEPEPHLAWYNLKPIRESKDPTQFSQTSPARGVNVLSEPNSDQIIGYNVYMPVKGSDQTIWIQAPLDQEERLKNLAGSTVTGLWLPAGDHSFVPAERQESIPKKIALIQIGNRSQDRFIDRNLSPAWPIFCGMTLFCVSSIIYIIAAPASCGDTTANSPQETKPRKDDETVPF